MRLLLDLGNTRLKAACWGEGKAQASIALAHALPEFEAQFGQWLSRETASGATAWLAAVAPDSAIARTERVLRDHGIATRRVTTQAEALGLRVAYAEPSRLGVDRWLAMLAARAASAQPVLIVGVGSALTIDAVDAQGQHLGGLIAPPPEAMRAALVARAPRLDVSAGRVRRFAASTEDAIVSGCVLSAAALIERSLRELAAPPQAGPRLLLSGGGATELRPWLPPHEFAPQLVLEGLARWAQHVDA